jgi:pimeloyl-ACP methyl ester carboxylesterase
MSALPLERHRWSPPSGETREVGLHVRTCGSGPRTLLLLHGLAGSHRYFGAAFDALAQDAVLVVPDLLGFGRSARPTDVDYGPDAHTDALLAALQRLGAPAALHVVTHSAAAIVALRLAARCPERVHSVTAFGPPLYRSAAEARRRIEALGRFERFLAMDTIWARLACGWMCRHRAAAARIAAWLRPDLPLEIAGDSVRHSWISYSRTVRNLLLESRPLADLARVSCPVRLIAGADDALVDAVLLRELVQQHPQLCLELWPGGHDLPLSAPQRCVDAVRCSMRSGEAEHELSAAQAARARRP